MNKSPLVIFSIGIFFISTLFPVVASLLPTTTVPTWIGASDVLIALIVVGILATATTKVRGKINETVKNTSSNIYQSLAGIPLLLLAIYFIFGDKIHWEILLPGLAWRAWVLLYSIPSMIALWESE